MYYDTRTENSMHKKALEPKYIDNWFEVSETHFRKYEMAYMEVSVYA